MSTYRELVDLRVERVVVGLVAVARALYLRVVRFESAVLLLLQRQVRLHFAQLGL